MDFVSKSEYYTKKSLNCNNKLYMDIIVISIH